ncbi:DUF1827 family protein [Carnobacterium funditum]|uniref:DUF1827 family protein n=1 Tax=Carnobacterium funditum TaxID=2752 RepID=UPI00054F8C60|nr:DUF1827 family protein [Carnobacterium funditum]
MKLIDVTNSHIDLVTEQLGSTDANFIKVYTLGPTTIIFSGAPTHEDVLLLNNHRNIKNTEIQYAIENILEAELNQVDILHAPNIVELSIQVEQ